MTYDSPAARILRAKVNEDLQSCARFRELDARFGTDPRSPLHHDNRCPIVHSMSAVR